MIDVDSPNIVITDAATLLKLAARTPRKPVI